MRTIICSLICMLSVTASSPAAPFYAGQVSSRALWMMHADVDLLKSTRMGQFMLDELQEQHTEEKFAAFQAIFNFDPRKDLSAVTLYGTGNAPEDGVMLARGRFDANQLITLLKANDTYQEQNYGSHIVRSWIDENKHHHSGQPRRTFGSIHPNGVVVMGEGEAMVKEALDVLDGKQAGLGQSALMQQAALAGPSSFLLAFADFASIADLEPHAAIMQKARSGYLSIGEQGDYLQGDLVLTADSDQSAMAIQAIVQGMIAFAMLAQEEKPEMANLASMTTVSREDLAVKLAFKYPVADAIASMKAGKECHTESEPAAETP